MTEIRDSIGQQLKDLRIAKGLSMAELAESAGVAKNTIFRIEQGKFSVRLDILDNITKSLDSEIKIVKKE